MFCIDTSVGVEVGARTQVCITARHLGLIFVLLLLRPEPNKVHFRQPFAPNWLAAMLGANDKEERTNTSTDVEVDMDIAIDHGSGASAKSHAPEEETEPERHEDSPAPKSPNSVHGPLGLTPPKKPDHFGAPPGSVAQYVV